LENFQIALLPIKSFFDDKLKNGRDPFFPLSTRTQQAAPIQTNSPPPKLVKPVLVLPH